MVRNSSSGTTATPLIDACTRPHPWTTALDPLSTRFGAAPRCPPNDDAGSRAKKPAAVTSALPWEDGHRPAAMHSTARTPLPRWPDPPTPSHS
jgi:hypothetical protein